nr:E3 ubiquitin-protein ligase TRIM39-like [Pelodiscus sinensis]|eukprot:XP_014432718.1 E3 ubiquitin-protein ligase TRIM39-like [Pelodiscus sinensis]
MLVWIKSATYLAVLTFIFLIGRRFWDGFTVTVRVDPEIALVGQGVILSCHITGQLPTNYQVRWYRLERNKNTTLYFYNNLSNGTEMVRAGDHPMSDALKGWYENGVVTVRLFPVQKEDTGKYVCEVTGDGVYKEADTQVIVADKRKWNGDKRQQEMGFLFCLLPFIYVTVEHIFGKRKSFFFCLLFFIPVIAENFFGESKCFLLPIIPLTTEYFFGKSQNQFQNEIDKGQQEEEKIHNTYANLSLDMALCRRKIRNLQKRMKNLERTIQELHRENEQLQEQNELLKEQNESKKEFPEAEHLQDQLEQLQRENEQLQEQNGNLQKRIQHLEEQNEQLQRENENLKKIIKQLKEQNESKKVFPEAEQLQRENEKLQEENGNLQKRIQQLEKQNESKKEFPETENLQITIREMQKEIDWRRARSKSDDITLDADTAHPNLSIAGDKKSLTHEAQPQKSPANPERFDATVCVLGSEGFSSGQQYWEVDVERSTEWDLGVALKSIARKGKLSLSPKEGFWVLGQSGRDYWAKTDPWTRVIVQKKPKNIGVYFSYEERQVTFFNVTDMSVLFTFKDCSFSGEICPFFKNSHKETTMRIY